MTYCLNCNKELEDGKLKYCSKRCLNNYSVKKRRRKLKQMAIEYKGGKCEECGYNKSNYALTFHHKDPNEKEFGIGGKGETRSWESLKVELDKCVLLCANCHAEEHEKIDKINATLVDVVITSV